jgi:hypothetical protein
MIKNFDDFWSKVNDAFNNPVEIRWIDKEVELIGLFSVNNKVYNILCKNVGSNIWTFKFYHFIDNELSPRLTNDYKNSFKVLPTIKIAFEYLISEKSPNSIIFGSLDKSEGRKKLYNSFSIDISKKYNYEYTTNKIDNNQIFILSKEIDKEILLSKVAELIEDI